MPPGGIPAAGAPLPAGVPDQQEAEAPEQLDPDEARRQELLEDPEFAKFVKLYKMKIPLLSIRNQLRGSKHDPDDILLFANKGDIMALKKIGDYKGDKY